VQWFEEITAAGETLNRPSVVGALLRECYERVGFVDVQQRIFKLPVNGWAKDEKLKDLGQMWEKNLLTGLSGFSYRLFNSVYGRSPAEIEVRNSPPLFDSFRMSRPSGRPHTRVECLLNPSRSRWSTFDKIFRIQRYTPSCPSTSSGDESPIPAKARFPHRNFNNITGSSRSCGLGGILYQPPPP